MDLFGLVDGGGAVLKLLLVAAHSFVLLPAPLCQHAVLSIQFSRGRVHVVLERLLALLLFFWQLLDAVALRLLDSTGVCSVAPRAAYCMSAEMWYSGAEGRMSWGGGEVGSSTQGGRIHADYGLRDFVKSCW